jgi:hypothetical protein
MTSIQALQDQLTAATTEQRRLQAALTAAHDAELQRNVDLVCAEIDTGVDAHAVMEWMNGMLWSDNAEAVRGALAQVINAYLIADDKDSA